MLSRQSGEHSFYTVEAEHLTQSLRLQSKRRRSDRSPRAGREIVEVCVLRISAGCAEWALPVVEARETVGGVEEEVVAVTRRRFRGRRPGRIVRLVIMNSRDDADDCPELAEQCNARLKLCALVREEPVPATHLDVLELAERRPAHAGNAAAGFDCDFPVPHFDHPTSETDDLLPRSEERRVG